MKYALIGCGRIAVNHIKAALNNKLQIVAVCDVIADKMEALLAKYDLQNDKSIKHYTDYKQMLAENLDIELISIATESGVHAEIALYCIEHGKNVIIEKPMAMAIRIVLTWLCKKCAMLWKQAVLAKYRMVQSMCAGIAIKIITTRRHGAEHGHRTAAL